MASVMGTQRVASAIAYLMSQRLDARAAWRSLRHARSGAELLRAFWVRFPKEFAHVVDPAGGLEQADDSEVLMYFAELVNSRMFPLPEYFIQQWNDTGEFPALEIDPIQPDWNDYETEDLPYAWRVLQVLNGHFQPDVVVQVDKLPAGLVTPISEPFDISVLESLCDRIKSPLKHLALAYRVYAHDCGNVWLDYSYEMGMDFDAEWCLEDLERLEADHDLAVEMERRVRDFDEWLKRDVANIRKVKALLERAAKPPRIRLNALVDILV